MKQRALNRIPFPVAWLCGNNHERADVWRNTTRWRKRQGPPAERCPCGAPWVKPVFGEIFRGVVKSRVGQLCKSIRDKLALEDKIEIVSGEFSAAWCSVDGEAIEQCGHSHQWMEAAEACGMMRAHRWRREHGPGAVELRMRGAKYQPCLAAILGRYRR